MDTVMTLIAAFTGSLGFAVLFGVRNKLLLPASLGGLISWGTYLLFTCFFTEKHMFFNYFMATVIVAVYVHIMAYSLKAATIVFLFPSIIPLVPGSDLYYTFLYLCQNERDQMNLHIGNLCRFVFSIAAGMTVVWAVKSVIRNIKQMLERLFSDKRSLTEEELLKKYYS